jgi:hypothetical protein
MADQCVTVLKAAETVARWHADQKSKSALAAPCISHLLEVASPSRMGCLASLARERQTHHAKSTRQHRCVGDFRSCARLEPDMCVMRSVDDRPSAVRRQLDKRGSSRCACWRSVLNHHLLAVQNSCTIGKKHRAKL